MSLSMSASKAALLRALDARDAGLETARANLLARKAAFTEERSRTKRPYTKPLVVLDVGGTRVKISVASLRSQESILATMFSPWCDVLVDADGCVFLDRDPVPFRYIASFLRGETLNVKPKHKAQLLKEAEVLREFVLLLFSRWLQFFEIRALVSKVSGRNVEEDGDKDDVFARTLAEDATEEEKFLYAYLSAHDKDKKLLNAEQRAFERQVAQVDQHLTKIRSMHTDEVVQMQKGVVFIRL